MVEISHQKKKVFLSSYLCEFLLLLIFLSNNFGFFRNNNTQLYFVKTHKTILSEYFFVSKSINKFVEATTSDKQLLKLSKTCSILINLASMSIQTFCVSWFQAATIVWFLLSTLSKIKVLCRYLRIFIHFSLFLWEIDDCKHCFVYIFIE